LKYAVGFIAASIIWIAILLAIPFPEGRTVVYDCGMAEWHPDIPKEIKEACRKRRSEHRQGLTI